MEKHWYVLCWCFLSRCNTFCQASMNTENLKRIVQESKNKKTNHKKKTSACAQIAGRRPVKMLWSLRYAGVPVIGSCLAASRVTVPHQDQRSLIALRESDTQHWRRGQWWWLSLVLLHQHAAGCQESGIKQKQLGAREWRDKKNKNKKRKRKAFMEKAHLFSEGLCEGLGGRGGRWAPAMA